MQILKKSIPGDCIWNPIQCEQEYSLAFVEEEMLRSLKESGKGREIQTLLTAEVENILRHKVTATAFGHLIWYDLWSCLLSDTHPD